MATITIKPEREYLREIASKIKSGKYVIPVFQRDFVWKKEQVIDLFDSISKGYPIGSVILWKPEKNSMVFKAKDILTDKTQEVESPEFYVLDGRQRLTTFYGCVTKDENKNEKFKLAYNLERDCFEYTKGKKKNYLLELPDIYDTFSLLNCLQDILKNVTDKERASKYIERAKLMNTRLQSYEIGEVMIENCSLNEAGTVFSRINSKGTDISKVSMLQAIYYKNDQSPLLSDELERLIDSLGGYGFEKLKTDDVLNCCCRYIGKNFYDNNIMEEMIKSDITKFLPEIKKDITSAVKFLHEECGVISYKMLPYAKQLIGLTTFFKEVKNPSNMQLKEMKKWFFYTTVSQAFLNSSLNNVRTIFRQLDKYISGEAKHAIEYEETIELPALDFRFSTQSALSNLLMITLVKEYYKQTPSSNVVYCGHCKLLKDSSIGIVLYLTIDDKREFTEALNNGSPLSDLKKYGLTEELFELWKNNELEKFKEQRNNLLIKAEVELLEEMDITVTIPNRLSSTLPFVLA